jgi:hypothetical protein
MYVRSTHGDKRNLYRVLVGKPEGKRPLRRPGHRWEGDIKMTACSLVGGCQSIGGIFCLHLHDTVMLGWCVCRTSRDIRAA